MKTLLVCLGLACHVGAHADSAVELGAPLGQQALDAHRGMASVHNHSDLEAIVAGNSAEHVTTGVNAIDSGALVGNTGFPTVIQNSGNNVLIQNSLILNIQFQ